MNRSFEHRRWPLYFVILCASAGQALGLAVASITPAGYETSPLTKGARCYLDAEHTVTEVPPALGGAVLLQTRAADASDQKLMVSFHLDVRAEVYVCRDSRAATPAWLSSWVDTGMTVGVSDAEVGAYKVHARRFAAGSVRLPGNRAGAMYFVAVKESLPILPRNGWILLSYDMPGLREVIRTAPEYDVNHIQLSHDIIMNTHQVLEEPRRRADINELIDLAHAYGVTEVVLWTHEVCQHGMPSKYRAPRGHPAAGRADGNNPGMWKWMAQRYVDLFDPERGCPEADGVVLTFSEVDDNVYAHPPDPRFPEKRKIEFKYDGHTPTESTAKVIKTIQDVCGPRGKTLFPRLWVGFDVWARKIIRDAIEMNDASVWMMNKNIAGIDWPIMDTYHELTGSLPSHPELIEFDLCGEYMGRSESTFVMTAYLKDQWNYALKHGADGAVARIGRTGAMMYYTPNRLSMYGFKEILANPQADPRAVNLAWCRRHFPLQAARDIADHYDAPDSPWEGDTRFMTWEAYRPGDCPISSQEALGIAYEAIKRIDRHKGKLELQTTLDTRHGLNDYETLRSGIAKAIEKLGGEVPRKP